MNILHPSNNINPNFITGFTNADASFMLKFQKAKTGILPYYVSPVLVYTQHENDLSLLHEINQFFNNSGHIVKDKRNNCYNLNFTSVPQIVQYIIPHFSNPLFGLRGQKKKDFIIWKHVIGLIQQKEHLNLKGLINIIEISLHMYSVNDSKSKKLVLANLYSQHKIIKSDIDPLDPLKPLFEDNNTDIDPWFITGLIQGDGSPLGFVFKKNGVIGQYFAIGLAVSDMVILEDIKKYFNNSGSINKIKESFYRYVIYDKTKILNLIVPHFELYPLRGYRLLQYQLSVKYLKTPSPELKEQIHSISFEGKRRRNQIREKEEEIK